MQKDSVRGTARELPPQTELTLYRAGQEGLTNVRKHAPGARVWMALNFQDPTKVHLSVRDDGPGAVDNAAAAGSGFGLLGLAEGTVKNHMSNILAKLGVLDRTQAALKARELGLV